MLPVSVSALVDANNPSLMALASPLRVEDHFSPPLCEEHGAEWGKQRDILFLGGALIVLSGEFGARKFLLSVIGCK